MRIRQAAKALRVSPEWLRQLEREGKIPRAQRDRNEHRRYSPEDLQRLWELLYPARKDDAK